MSNEFRGTANIGTASSFKTLNLANGPRPVLEFRAYFDRSIPDGDGGFVDKGGFWLDVSVWGPRAEPLSKLLQKGMRIRVEGSLELRPWIDKESGEDRSAFTLHADYVAIDPSRIERIQMREKAPRDEAAVED